MRQTYGTKCAESCTQLYWLFAFGKWFTVSHFTLVLQTSSQKSRTVAGRTFSCITQTAQGKKTPIVLPLLKPRMRTVHPALHSRVEVMLQVISIPRAALAAAVPAVPAVPVVVAAAVLSVAAVLLPGPSLPRLVAPLAVRPLPAAVIAGPAPAAVSQLPAASRLVIPLVAVVGPTDVLAERPGQRVVRRLVVTARRHREVTARTHGLRVQATVDAARIFWLVPHVLLHAPILLHLQQQVFITAHSHQASTSEISSRFRFLHWHGVRPVFCRQCRPWAKATCCVLVSLMPKILRTLGVKGPFASKPHHLGIRVGLTGDAKDSFLSQNQPAIALFCDLNRFPSRKGGSHSGAFLGWSRCECFYSQPTAGQKRQTKNQKPNWVLESPGHRSPISGNESVLNK